MPSPPVLVDITRNGQRVPALAQIGKTGWMFILNRVTGESIFGVEERPGYTLELWVYEGKLLGRPRLPEPKPGKTYYAAFRFGRPEELKAAARQGSLCSRLFLAVKGLCP